MKNLEIAREFDRIIKDQTEDWSLKEYLEDVCKYGQDAFSYYYETSKLYDKCHPDCESWLDDLLSERGLYPWEFFTNWDIAVDSKENKWMVIVAMFEEYCYDLLDEMD